MRQVDRMMRWSSPSGGQSFWIRWRPEGVTARRSSCWTMKRWLMRELSDWEELKTSRSWSKSSWGAMRSEPRQPYFCLKTTFQMVTLLNRPYHILSLQKLFRLANVISSELEYGTSSFSLRDPLSLFRRLGSLFRRILRCQNRRSRRYPKRSSWPEEVFATREIQRTEYEIGEWESALHWQCAFFSATNFSIKFSNLSSWKTTRIHVVQWWCRQFQTARIILWWGCDKRSDNW